MDKVKQNNINHSEDYLLASRNPWLVWRLQAFRAGYVPPLVTGKIPPELANLNFSPRQKYDIDNLLDHAKKVEQQQKQWKWKTIAVSLCISALLLLGLFYSVNLKKHSGFEVNFIKAFYSTANSGTAMNSR